MKQKSIIGFFISMLFLISCEVNDPKEGYESKTIDGITLIAKDGTLTSPGEIEIVNNSDREIFVPYFLQPSCYFSIYLVEQKIGSVWEPLLYDESESKWIRRDISDSVFVICELNMNPIQIRPNNRYKQKITGINDIGEYRLKIFFRDTEYFNNDKKLAITYQVK